MEKPPARSPDSGVHEPLPGDSVTERDLNDLHEDILDENEENVRHLLREIVEDGLSVCELCHTELQVEPLAEDHPLNRQSLSALHRAALLDSNSILTVLLSSDPGIDANLSLKASGYTPLHVASLAGIPATASYLAFNGAKVNVKDKKGRTPIHLCAQNGHVDIAKVLVVKGGQTDSVDARKRTPLHYACEEGQLKFVNFLLKKNVEVDVVDEQGWSPLHCALSRGQDAIVEALLGTKANLINAQDLLGNTPLHIVTMHSDQTEAKLPCGDFDACLDMLLSSPGINIHLSNLKDESALHLAVEHNYLKATQQLLTLGIKINAQDHHGESAIFRANSSEVLDLLLGHADLEINLRSKSGDSVLHHCTRSKLMSCQMLSMLIAQGADVDATNYQLESALHLACKHGFSDKVRVLLDSGARRDLVDCAGQSILHAAIENGHSGMAKTLVAGDFVRVDIQNKRGQNALHLAIMCRMDIELITMLVDKCMDVNVADEQGLYPADYAVRKCDVNATRLLLNRAARLSSVNSSFLLTFATDDDLEIVKHLQSLRMNPGLRDDKGRSLLHLAIINQAWKLASHLIQTNARCDLADHAGNTPLHMAALICRSTQLVDDLVTNSTSIDKRNLEGSTPLHNAALNDCVDVMEILMQLGAKLYAQDKRLRTPMHVCGEYLVAAKKESDDEAVEICQQKLELILDHFEPNDPEIHTVSAERKQIIHLVCEAGDRKLTNTCLQKGSKVDKCDQSGRRPLHYACMSGCKDVVQLLLNHGAAADDLDLQGQTALFYAVSSGNEESVELLLASGADPNVQRNTDQATVLHIALQNKNLGLAEILLMHDINVNLQNSNGQSAFHLVAKFGSRDVVEACHALKPNPSLKDNSGRHAIHYAVFNQDTSVIKSLLSAGWSVDAVDGDGNTPLLLSAKEGSYEHMSILIESQADVNVQNNDEMSPIHYAISHQEPDLLELLIANEADLDVQDKVGRSPLIHALDNGDLESAQVLFDQHVDLSLVDNQGDSALHKLVQMPKMSQHYLRSLSRKGCDFYLKNNAGVTPVELLNQRKDINVDEVMLMLEL